MKKKHRTALICVFMALVMAVLSPLQAFAAGQKQYISDIRMADSAEKLEALGYQVLEQDLNAGGNEGFTYIGCKMTTDPEEAITDIAVMDMKGGYSFSDYEEMLKRQKAAVQEQATIYRVAVDEFRTRYQAGGTAARLAFDALNNYIEDDSGKRIGDLFVDTALSNEELTKIMMEGSLMANTSIIEGLASALARDDKGSWLDRIAQPGDEDFYDDAIALMDAAAEVRDTLQEYEAYQVPVDDASAMEAFLAEATPEELLGYNACAALYLTLRSHKYQDGTLADFFANEELSYEELYPVIAAMTPGQLAVAKLSGFLTLMKYADLTPEQWEQAQEKYEPEALSEPISVYTGVDRSFYRGGVALTSDAKRKSASTGDNSWFYGNFNNAAEISLHVAFGVSVLTIIGSIATMLGAKAAANAASVAMELAAAKSEEVLVSAGMNSLASGQARSNAVRWFVKMVDANWLAKVGTVALYVSLAAMLIIVGVYLGLELGSYYHPTYTDIPNILLDLKYGQDDEVGDWEKYIRYDVVLDEAGNKADLNQFHGKQWNAMYVTRDRTAGDPISADSLIANYHDATTPRGFSPVHYFGNTDAFDLNSHCYNNKVGGVFLFFRRDADAFATETASVVSSGAALAVVGFSGLIVGALGMALFTRKKKEEPV